MFEYNNGQRRVIDAAKQWYRHSSEQVFEFAGDPGTGKSVVLHAIVSELGLDYNKVAAMTFMGAAAVVMRLKGFRNAKTIHSWLYSPVIDIQYDEDGNEKMNTYFDRPQMGLEFIPKPLGDMDLIVIDEAGMVPYDLKEEIESRGIKVLACGDRNQLPALYSKPAYLVDDNIMRLTEIARQNAGSAIIYLSQRAINGLPIHKGFYAPDVLVIDEDELTDEMLLNADIVLCGKNATKDNINNHIRHDLLGLKTTLPVYGEKLICRQNNWKLDNNGINLANGLTGIVTNSPDVGNFDGKTFTIDFKPNLLNSSFIGLKCDYQYFTAPTEKKAMFKNNKYFKGEKFEFAYATTTHLSQGSQYRNGIYIEEYLNKDINKNLNFTGITRFSNSLIYVKPRRKFY